MLGTLPDEQVQSVLEAIGSAAFVVRVDDDGTFRYLGVNAALTRQMGVAPADIRGRTPEEVLTPADAAVVVDNYRRCIASAGPIDCEEELGLPVGRRWWFTSLMPHAGPDGRIVRVLGTCFDITERKRVEADLRASRTFLEGVLESIPASIFCKEGPDFRYTFINRTVERTFGTHRRKVLGRSDYEIYDKGTADALRSEDLGVFAAPGTVATKIELIPTPMGPRNVRTSKTAIAGPDGRPRYLLGISEDVTDRVRLESELRVAKDFLQAVLDHIPAIIFSKEAPSFRFTLLNRMGERYFGVSREDIVGKVDHELFPQGQADFFRRKDIEALESGTAITVAVEPLQTPFGERMLRTSKMAIPGEDGRPRYVLGVAEDITDRVVAEERLRAAVEGMRDGFILFDRDDRIVLYNSRFLEMYDYLKDHLPMEGRTFQDNIVASREWRRQFMSEEEVDAYVAARLAHWRSGGETPLEQRLPDGRWVLVSERPTADGGIVAIHTDITEQKRAEIRLVDAIESIDQGFILCDEQDRVVLTNRRIREMFPSVAPVMVPGASVRELIRLGAESGDYRRDAESLEQAVEALYRLYRDGTVEGIERQLRDGRWVLFSQHVTPSGLRVGLRTDITLLKARQQQLVEIRDHLQRQTAELIRMTNDLRQARQRADEANRAKSQFLAMISHELRTPFTGIRGMADLLAGTRLDPDQARYLEVMRRSFDRLLALLDQLLDFSRIEAGRVDVVESRLVPARLLADAATTFRATAAAKGIDIDIRVAPDVPREVLGDPGKINQILANLIGNAVKFTERGGVAIGVSMTGDSDRPMLRWTVADTGIGLSEAEMARLFEPFSQADSSTSRRFGGTGLGLAISRRLAEAMGGRIGVESEVGSGSLFWFTTSLRLADRGAAAVRREGTAETAGGAGRSADGEVYRILIAEDDTINQLLIDTMLKRWGFDTVVVGDGQAALDLLRRERFDAVLMDINMPVLDGPSAVRRLRAEGGSLATLPVFALTADVVAEHVEGFRAAGFTDVMGKPIDWNRLRASLEALRARRIA
ncbi:MAG: PAS domain-containing protein [Alphaproteobacteria bacterium]|nr:PAS domain-containing protein [Alphaproteobacteria bacterium]